MSMRCVLREPYLLVEALGLLLSDPDAWVTCIFREECTAVLHVGGRDRSSTFTAILPQSLFSEFQSTDVRFRVHLATFQRTLLLLGLDTLSAHSTQVSLDYTTVKDKLTVAIDEIGEVDEAAPGASQDGEQGAYDSGRRMESVLDTRPMPSMLLDLRFEDALLEGEATVDSRVLRDVLQDFTQAACPEVLLEFLSPSPGSPCDLRLKGSTADMELTEIISADRGEKDAAEREAAVPVLRTRAKTTVSTTHLALAGGSKPRSGPSGGGGSFIGTGLNSCERVQLRVNAMRQLNVIHTRRCGEANMTISVVVMPKLTNFDDW